ncbi:MAG TPA: hypothetical protein VGG97_05410 [Bryobacteraceae bacterium]
MDGDRKYKQQGYQQDSGRSSDPYRFDQRPKQQGPKQPIDITGPKLPRLVQNVAASRCYNCTTTLLPDIHFDSICPKCKVALHCCKQCVHFDSSTRFQCLKPIPVRIPVKDQANTCELFSPRVTVARDALPSGPAARVQESSVNTAPRNATDARAAFDSLFKK